MGWTRPVPPTRRPRAHRRPDAHSLGFRPVDRLEGRRLLATAQVQALDIWEPTPSGTTVAVSNPTFDDATGAAAVRAQYGVDGSGLAAAVVDTGVDYHNPDLGGTLGQADSAVASGWDFGDSDADPSPTWQHGTNVAGLIASRDPNASGVAPGAGLAALKVFDSSNKSSFARVADALGWVVANHQRLNITVVNLSISDNNNYVNDWFSGDGAIGGRIAGLVHQLKDLNIPVVTSAGNSFQGKQGMGFTAILGETISVTALDSSDQALLADAQRLGSALGGFSATDLAAPGQALTTIDGDGGFASVEGTSFSAPLVSGSILLLQQIYQRRFGSLPSVDMIEGWLEVGSSKVFDPTTGITLNRLDLAKAAALVPGSDPAPAPAPVVPLASTPFSMTLVNAPADVVAQTAPVQAAPATPVEAPPPAAQTVDAPATETRAARQSATNNAPKGLLSRFRDVLTGGIKNLNVWRARAAR